MPSRTKLPATLVLFALALGGCGSCTDSNEGSSPQVTAAPKGKVRPFRMHWDGGRRLIRRHGGDGGAEHAGPDTDDAPRDE